MSAPPLHRCPRKRFLPTQRLQSLQQLELCLSRPVGPLLHGPACQHRSGGQSVRLGCTRKLRSSSPSPGAGAARGPWRGGGADPGPGGGRAPRAGMAGQFRSYVWDPLLILSQIVLMQTVYYGSLGLWLALVDGLVRSSPSLDQMFDAEFSCLQNHETAGIEVVDCSTESLALDSETLRVQCMLKHTQLWDLGSWAFPPLRAGSPRCPSSSTPSPVPWACCTSSGEGSSVWISLSLSISFTSWAAGSTAPVSPRR
ncbi:protein SYS1 homolog isoform X2 [Phocoena sinus]|uniref:protein SYS1 homolog isoform X2 n=1 Tax=Phocoena sinus TaxID=42100 RepID=UPI0013C431EC|nr:protein SYS1 homolog isoform X2 [Phocoena sinus]